MTTHYGGWPVPSFPTRSLLACLAVTLLLVAVLAWRLWSAYLGIQRASGEDLHIQRLSGDVVHLDEVLTMSARMAAATGNPHWEERYRIYEPQLDASIKDLMRLASDTSMKDAATRANAANLSLVEMEHQAFDLVRRGHREEGANLLTGGKYDAQKRLYAQGALEITADLQNRADAVLRGERQAFRRVFLFAIAAMPVLLLLWVGVLGGVRRHIAERKRAEYALMESEGFKNAILDSLPAHMAVLDENGIVLAVNESWVRFAEENGLPNTKGVCAGADYLAVCRKAANAGDPLAREALEGIEAVLTGRQSAFTMEYPCHSPTRQRWFLMNVVHPSHGLPGAVITHLDITQRKKTEETLLAAQKQYRDLVESSPDAIFVDRDNRIGFLNPAALQLFRTTDPARLLGRSPYDVFHPDCHPVMHERNQQLQAGHSVPLIEEKILRMDGTVGDVEAAAAPFVDAQGPAIQVIVRDISERKCAERAIREMAAFPDENPYPVLRLSQEGTLLYANRASDQLLEEFGGGVGERAPSILAQPAARTLENNLREEFDLSCRGRVFSFLAAPIAEQNYVNLYGRDVTERRQAEAALRRIEWLLQGGRLRERDRESKSEAARADGDLVQVNRSGELLALVGGDVLEDIAGDYLDILETSTAIYEKNGDYALGIFRSDWCRFMHQASRRLRPAPEDQETIASGHCHRSCWDEASRIAMDERRPVDIDCLGGIRIYALPIVAGGEVVGSINFGYGDPPRDPAKLKELAEQYGVTAEELQRLGASYESRPPFLIDAAKRRLATSARLIGEIVERRRAEQQMKAAKEAAEAANSAKDHFLAVLSHELRTPLTPVLINAGVMESDERLPEEVRAEMGLIRRSLELEARLIDDLLDLNRITKGKLHFRFAAVDAHAKLQNVLDICRTEAQEKGIRLVCDLDARESYVSGDGGRVQQVFWNVIKNAIKFTPPNGEIRVRSLNPCPRTLRVEIVDTGIGIGSELMPQLFNAFEQGGPAITRQFGGLGLGLTISKALVDMHGGTIRADSEGPGRGATFTLELPTITVPASEQSRPVQLSYGSPLRILLVEDHAISREVLKRALARVGHQVQTASDVRSALELVATSEFDVLVSDLGLPDASGLDLMNQLRSSRPDLVGLALSGYGTEEDIRRSKEAGFAEHLTKPVELSQLRATIDQVFASRASV